MKKISLFIIMLLILILPCYSDELADDYFDMAENYLTAGETSKALEYLNYVLIIDSKYSKAVEMKNRILPLATNDDLSRTKMTLDKQKQLSGLSIIDIPKSVSYQPVNTSEYYNRQGKQYYLSQDYDNAIKSFFMSVSADNQNYIAYNNLGMTYMVKNNLTAAEKYFKKSAQVSKTYIQPYINLALLYKQKGDNDKYLSYLKKALKVNPEDYRTHYLIGDYYTSKDNYPESIPYYIKSVNLNSNFAPSQLALAISYFKTDKYDKSIDTLKNYIILNPTSDFAYSMFAKNYYLLGDYQNAKNYMKKAVKLNPTTIYRLELAKIEYNTADYQNALFNLEIVEPEYPYADVYNYMGLCNLAMRRFELAILNFNKAIVADSRRPIYYYNLSQCYKELDDKIKYVQYLNIALQVTPINPLDYIDLSCIYYNTGKYNLAIKILENGIEMNPDNKTLYLALMILYEKLNDNAGYNSVKMKIEKRFNTNA